MFKFYAIRMFNRNDFFFFYLQLFYNKQDRNFTEGKYFIGKRVLYLQKYKW